MGWRIKELYIESIEQLVLWEKKTNKIHKHTTKSTQKETEAERTQSSKIGRQEGSYPRSQQNPENNIFKKSIKT